MEGITTILCNQCSARLSFDRKPHPQIDVEQLRSMQIPSDAELAQMLSVVEHGKRDLARYDEEICRLSEILDNLKNQRERLRDYRDRYVSMCSSARKLPAEVLGKIFAECCHAYSLSVDRKGLKVPALDISQTCSFWRKVILSSPELWANLRVDLGQTDDHFVRDLINLYLARSVNAGLRLDISALDPEKEFPFSKDGTPAHKLGDDCWEAFKSLLDVKDRWVNVSFDLSWQLYKDAHNHVPIWNYGNQEKMETLSLKWDVGCLEILELEPTDLFHIFGRASALRSLNLWGSHREFCFPFQHLEKLEISESFLNISDFCSVLQRCSHLNFLNISVGAKTRHADDHDVSAQIIMEQLSSFTFDFQEYKKGYKFISSITCPSLDTFVVTTNGRVYGNTALVWRTKMVRSLKSFLLRSTCQISCLEFSGSGILFRTDRELIELLQLCPTVVDFKLNLNDFFQGVLNENFLQDLTFPDASSDYLSARTILPKLKSLCLTFKEQHIYLLPESDDSLSLLPDGEAILSLVSSRRLFLEHASPGLQKLAHFELSFEARHDKFGLPWIQNFCSNFEPRLRALEKGGMSLSLELLRPLSRSNF